MAEVLAKYPDPDPGSTEYSLKPFKAVEALLKSFKSAECREKPLIFTAQRVRKMNTPK